MLTQTPDPALLDHIIGYVLSEEEPGQLARERASRSIADSLGVMLGGSRSDLAAPMLSYARAMPGSVIVIGTDHRASGEAAALLNATFGHALDFDDGFPGYPFHVGNIVTACLISASLGMRASGHDFCTAFIRGLETAIALGRRIGIRHYERGFHATGTIGVFAGIAACAALSRPDAATLRQAFGIGASFASGLQRNIGTMTKPLHAGWAARNAIAALDLARAGISAHPDILSGGDGFLAAFGEADDPSVSTAAPTFDAVTSIGLSLKKYPCVNVSHRAIDGLLALRAAHGLDPGNVTRITCLLPPGCLRPIKHADPRTPDEAKFSLNYLLSAALTDGTIGLASFTEDAVVRENVRALYSRIVLREDAACSGPPGEVRSAGTRGVIVTQAETSTDAYETEVAFAPGNPRREMTRADLSEKISGCAAYAGLPPKQAAEVCELILELPQAVDVGEALSRIGQYRSPPTATGGRHL